MPRRARLRFAGVPLHIVQRGNNRIPCFFAEGDYRFYLRHLEELAERFGCGVHAYVLMTNHVHLLVTPSETDSASLLMKHLGQRYVQYVNRNYGRSGTLWEGRFKSSLVQQDGYLLKCQRYIELNPVRAGMVLHPGDYPWSSYRASGDLRPSAFLTPHGAYLALGERPEQRAEAYRRLVQCELNDEDLKEIRSAANGGFALGNQDFKAEIGAILGKRVERLRQRLQQRASSPG
jgi:putative transposase